MAIRLGTEDKKKRLIAGVLVSIALTAIGHLVWTMAGGPSSPDIPTAVSNLPAISGASHTTTAVNGEAGPAAQRLDSAAELDPTLHPERMALAENTRYTGTSRNIFSKNSLPPVPIASIEKPVAPVRTGPGSAGNAGPPPPPPINLKFYGFATQQNGRKLVFLLNGEDVFVAGEGDIVDRRYKVLQVRNNDVLVEDLSYNNQQTLPLLTN
ncbi:MAG TPA: hypothetical protein VFN53_08310 [Acidobacteriaceae bacterium]|nr:hypothetical protein [Acidobacteriaceae bacterium]